MQGWVKFQREILNNPIICKDAEHFTIWGYLMLNATHKGYNAVLGYNHIELQPGQLITGRKVIAKKFNMDEYKVQRVLKEFETAGLISQKTTNKNRLVTILAWVQSQSEQQIAQQNIQQHKPLKDLKSTDIAIDKTENAQHIAQQNAHIQECTKQKCINNNILSCNQDVVHIIHYLNSKLGTKYKPSSKLTQKLIIGKMNEDFSIEDLKTVIDIKYKAWNKDPVNSKYLRPSTLFGDNFESYLNEKRSTKSLIKPIDNIIIIDTKPQVGDDLDFLNE